MPPRPSPVLPWTACSGGPSSASAGSQRKSVSQTRSQQWPEAPNSAPSDGAPTAATTAAPITSPPNDSLSAICYLLFAIGRRPARPSPLTPLTSMIAGLTNLDTLKKHLLATTLQPETRCYEVITDIGLGVAAQFENFRNRARDQNRHAPPKRRRAK